MPTFHPIPRPAILASTAISIRPAAFITHLSKVRPTPAAVAPLLGSTTHLLLAIAIIAPAAHLGPATRAIKVRLAVALAEVFAARARSALHVATPRAVSSRPAAKLLAVGLLAMLRAAPKLAACITAPPALARAMLLVMTMVLGKLLHRVLAMLAHLLALSLAATLRPIAGAITRPIAIGAHLARPVVTARCLTQRIALPKIKTQPHRGHCNQLVREIHCVSPIGKKFGRVPPTQPGRLNGQTFGRHLYCLFARSAGRPGRGLHAVLPCISAAITTGRGRWSAAR